MARFTRRLILIGLCLVVAIPQEVTACINTSYSRAEEPNLTDDITKILSGQIAEHSEEFYLREVERNQPESGEAGTFEQLNDLGAAFIKLKRYDEALAAFEEAEKIDPGRYETQSNLGVCYKKMGDFAKAAEHIEKALQIKPSGHMGLGDYYLRMLRWRAEGGETTGKNFLGIEYSDGADVTAENPVTNEEFLITLIKNDRHFADAYLVLGDVLFAKGDLQGAMRAYSYPQQTFDDDSRPSDSQRAWFNTRRRLVEEAMMKLVREQEGLLFDENYTVQISREKHAAETWLEEFKRTEADLIASGEEVDFGFVKSEMTRRGIDEPEYQKVGVFGDRHYESKTFAYRGAVVIVVALLFALFVLLPLAIFMRIRTRRRMQVISKHGVPSKI